MGHDSRLELGFMATMRSKQTPAHKQLRSLLSQNHPDCNCLHVYVYMVRCLPVVYHPVYCSQLQELSSDSDEGDVTATEEEGEEEEEEEEEESGEETFSSITADMLSSSGPPGES